MNPLTSAIIVSLKTSMISTMLCALIALPVAVVIAQNSFKGKELLIIVLQTLLAIPTVVVGLTVYALICRGAALGSLGLLFTQTAIVIGQCLLALPIMIMYAYNAIAALCKEVSDTARTLGASGLQTGALVLSEARHGILAAIAATFGRLIGEVGVSMMLGGNIAGYTRTMTTSIALETSKGEFVLGLQLGGILLAIALGVNICLRRLLILQRRAAERV
ncbi:MAG: ABC transporter permease subunit [Chitinivibrionales bacterium]|nr:ABC transporter permease subunit [Chitinivibrionales bacterium]